ncbi:MAG: nuclear transport factor 2 family protein [Bacteroidales bacterium]|nr:nuclear transport factor 2 family protein [Bacteroidales bacterium]
MRILFFISILTLLACNSQTISISKEYKDKQKQSINRLLDNWHKAAADADLENYFTKMSDDAIYLGTDASERWTKDEFYKFCKPYFNKDKAWDFKPSNRHIYFSDDLKTAWFEETLDTWMENCRGSGILVFKENNWKIKHYNLAVAVPNDVVKDYVKLLKKK